MFIYLALGEDLIWGHLYNWFDLIVFCFLSRNFEGQGNAWISGEFEPFSMLPFFPLKNVCFKEL